MGTSAAQKASVMRKRRTAARKAATTRKRKAAGSKAATTRTLRAFNSIASEFEVQMHNIAGHGNVVLTERTDILRGPLMEMEFWVCGTFEIREGKIVLWRDRADAGMLLYQLMTSPLRRLLSRRGRGKRSPSAA